MATSNQLCPCAQWLLLQSALLERASQCTITTLIFFVSEQEVCHTASYIHAACVSTAVAFPVATLPKAFEPESQHAHGMAHSRHSLGHPQ